MAQLQLAIDSGQGAAGITARPVRMAIDEATALNYNAAAAAWIDGLTVAGGVPEIVATQSGAAVPWDVVRCVQTPGSRHLSIEVCMANLTDGGTLTLAPGGGTNRNPTGVPGANAVAYWSLKDGTGAGTVTDISANANTGTLLQGPTWAASATGWRLTFDGFNDWMRVLDAASMRPTTGVSVVARVNPVSVEFPDRIITKEYNLGNTEPYVSYGLWFPSGNTINFAAARTNVLDNNLVTSGTIPGGWLTVAGTYGTTDGLRLFLNGTQNVADGTRVGNISYYDASALGIASRAGLGQYPYMVLEFAAVWAAPVAPAYLAAQHRALANNGAFWTDPVTVGGVRPRMGMLRHGPRLVMGGVL